MPVPPAGPVPSASPTISPTLTPVPPTLPAQSATPLPAPTHAVPTPTPLPYPPATVSTALLDVWPAPRAENVTPQRQTQLILGERVLVVRCEGAWAEIRAVEQPSGKDALGYPGWVRAAGLAPGWVESARWLVVQVPAVSAYAQDAANGEPLARLMLDTRLPVLAEQADWVRAGLPDGRSAWLPRAGLRLSDTREPSYLPFDLEPAALPLAVAPYLWGGTSPAAFDCSGFIYRLFHAHGLTLPRDSGDQAARGTPVAPGQAAPGDLLFYSVTAGGPVSHVGLQWQAGQVLDAELGLGLVLHPAGAVLANHVYVTARRVWPD
jgi:gamma-D-glutamyl-L-lysine dipeptidyl-peptidase